MSKILKNTVPHYRYGYPVHYYWIVDDSQMDIPDKDPCCFIQEENEDFFTIEGCRTVYKTHSEAYKAMIIKLKRKGLL